MYSLAGYGLGLASLAWNSFRARPEIRRRTRVMLWGTAGALVPVILIGTYAALRDLNYIDVPFWLWVGPLLGLFLLPVSFAYAVVKHRVMEIPVLLRRSARYVLVRHAIVTIGILVCVGLTFVFAAAFSRVLPDESGRALSGMAGAIFGVIVVMTTRKGVRKVTDRLDRAFFREAYDARQILQDLARKTRTAIDRGELASLLERSLAEALHPSTLTVLLCTPTGRLEPAATQTGTERPRIDAAVVEKEPILRSGVALIRTGELPGSLRPLEALAPDLLATMRGHDEGVEGLLVFGSRLSDEPYGAEDRELVASVASQAGTALENLRLAGAIAAQLEAERSAARELEIARDVQRMLLPQQLPALASLDYAGTCIQARQVGGDYYDFLYLGPGRLGLVLADISGKGISAALLMANLQASLRSHYAQTPDDLPHVLRAVNRSFFESSDATSGGLTTDRFMDTTQALNFRVRRHAVAGLAQFSIDGPDAGIRNVLPVEGELYEAETLKAPRPAFARSRAVRTVARLSGR
jgi:sigma-B regulation protein RsbU (phosphoserine phosphatase)